MSLLTRMFFACVLAGVAAIGGGCTIGPYGSPIPPSSMQAAAKSHPDARFFDGQSGEKLHNWDVFEKVNRADVVVFGELHGHPVGLPVAAAIWEDMLRVRDRDETPALLLEFFERDQQLAIDEYLGGMIDKETFIKEAGRTASNFPDAHQAMFNATKEAGGVVIAANAPRRYVRLARTDGYDRLRSMSPAQQAMFELPPTEDGPDAYRERFVEIMGGMRSMGDSGKEDAPTQPGMGVMDFLRAQLVWDATMADSVADALRAGHEPVALVIGRFHVGFDGATVEYIRRMRPGADVLTIVIVDSWSDELVEEDVGRGDIVIYAGPIERDGDAGES
ncbi:MAG: ChaN family lipoprotein [Phycisphaerales bacterium]|nr:ChaN family lipoprotein [Phycisphaerales bacterium]